MAEDEIPDDTGETVNAADPRAVQESRRTQRKVKEQGDDLWRRILGDEVGRREIWLFLQECHTFEDRFACGPNGAPQSEATWFQAGEKSVGLRLYRSLMRIDHDGLHKMHLEHDPAFPKPRRQRKPEEQ